MSLVTERLVLSAGTRSDAEALFPYVHGEPGRRVTDTLLWNGPDTVDDIHGFFRQHLTGTFADFGWHWIVRDRRGVWTGAQRSPIGALGFTDGGEPGVVEIGYWLAPPHWGKRIMPEAVSAAMAFAFEHAGCTRVRAEVFTQNVRGASMLDRLGFTRGDVLPRHVEKRGGRMDVIPFTASAATWPTTCRAGT